LKSPFEKFGDQCPLFLNALQLLGSAKGIFPFAPPHFMGGFADIWP
jgi:hypothetical protein